MLYHSLKNKNHLVTFDKALLNGLAPDKGLYFPNKIPFFSKKKINEILKHDNYTIAFNIIKKYIGNVIPEKDLISIIEKTLFNFKFPLHKIYNKLYSLELFHGPTLAFKDVGAKFMSGCLEYIIKYKKKPITVLVATSGDTGAAVAKGFHNIKGINVIILYPHNMISNIQENQINSLGDNIKVLKIKGNFDDCQNLVKKSFLDKELIDKCSLTSANSINIARWLPQTFYYFYAYKHILQNNNNNVKIIFSVPSGNFGNVCAGLISREMGLPINHFIASTNVNNTIPRFIKTGKYDPKNTIATLSNAMDISNPSNFIRIMHLYKQSLSIIKNKMSSYYFNDEKTLKIIKDVKNKYNYIMDPHGAIGYLGLKKYINYLENKNKNNKINNYLGIFLETAHPAKFMDKMPKDIKNNIIKPITLKNVKTKRLPTLISNDFCVIKEWLLNNI